MTTKLGIGVVGAGRATRDLTLPVFDLISNGYVAALCDTDLDVAQKLAQKYEISAYPSLPEMMKNKDMQIVIINTPVSTHAEMAIQAMRGGCHVIIEKPAVAHLEELEKLRQVADETGRKLTVVHNYKFWQGYQKALRMYGEGILGEIIHIDRVFMVPPQEDRMERDPDGWWHRIPGGRLADSLPHYLYIPYMFLGEMELVAVSARKLSEDRPWSCCDDADIVLRTPKAYVNIRLSTNQESWPYKGYSHFTIIYGSRLNVFVDSQNAWIMGRKFDFSRPLLKEIGFRARSYKDLLSSKFATNRSRAVISRGAHNVFYKKFIDYVNDRGQNPSTWDEIVNVATLSVEISDKMQECVSESKAVVL